MKFGLIFRNIEDSCMANGRPSITPRNIDCETIMQFSSEKVLEFFDRNHES